MLGPNVADKYSLAVTKNLGLGCKSQPCVAGHFLVMQPSSLSFIITFKFSLKSEDKF